MPTSQRRSAEAGTVEEEGRTGRRETYRRGMMETLEEAISQRPTSPKMTAWTAVRSACGSRI